MKLQCVWKSASSPSLSLWVFTFSLSLSLLLSSRPVFCPSFIFGSEPGTLRPPAPSHLRCCNKLGSFSSSYRFSWKLLWGALYFLDRYVFCSAGPTQLCIYTTPGRVEWLLTTWNRIKKKSLKRFELHEKYYSDRKKTRIILNVCTKCDISCTQSVDLLWHWPEFTEKKTTEPKSSVVAWDPADVWHTTVVKFPRILSLYLPSSQAYSSDGSTRFSGQCKMFLSCSGTGFSTADFMTSPTFSVETETKPLKQDRWQVLQFRWVQDVSTFSLPETCRPARHSPLTPVFLVSGIFFLDGAHHVSAVLWRLCTFLVTYEMFF